MHQTSLEPTLLANSQANTVAGRKDKPFTKQTWIESDLSCARHYQVHRKSSPLSEWVSSEHAQTIMFQEQYGFD